MGPGASAPFGDEFSVIHGLSRLPHRHCCLSLRNSLLQEWREPQDGFKLDQNGMPRVASHHKAADQYPASTAITLRSNHSALNRLTYGADLRSTKKRPGH
jgi:hypothetical protein